MGLGLNFLCDAAVLDASNIVEGVLADVDMEVVVGDVAHGAVVSDAGVCSDIASRGVSLVLVKWNDRW